MPDTQQKENWEVLEYAGLDNEEVVQNCASYKEAKKYVRDNYTNEEQKELSIDITRNRSTEY